MNRVIKIEWVKSSEQAADSLIKALSVQKYKMFIRQLNIVDVRDILA